MDSFFLADPVDLNEAKAKDTVNKNPKKFRKYQLVPYTQTLLHKEKVAHGKYGEHFCATCTKSSPCDSMFLSMSSFK